MIGMVFVGQQQFVVEAHHVEDGGERLVIGAVDGRCAEAGWIQFVSVFLHGLEDLRANLIGLQHILLIAMDQRKIAGLLR